MRFGDLGNMRPYAIQSRPLPLRCGSEMNQAEAGGHVTPKADEDGDWSPMHKACNERLPTAFRGTESHQNERDLEAM